MPRSRRNSSSKSRSKTRSRSVSRNRDRSSRSGSRGRYRRSRSTSRRRVRRSRSDSRGRDRNGYRGRYNDDRSNSDLCRVHIADLSEKATKSDIEKSFGKFGDIEEVWMAKNPPCFAFVVFKNKDDANDAIKEMDGR